jgi:hypothetical protein
MIALMYGILYFDSGVTEKLPFVCTVSSNHPAVYIIVCMKRKHCPLGEDTLKFTKGRDLYVISFCGCLCRCVCVCVCAHLCMLN